MRTSQRVRNIQHATLIGFAIGLVIVMAESPGMPRFDVGMWSIPLCTFVGWAFGFALNRKAN